MQVKVVVSPRAKVTAGLAKLVDEVNQYPARMVRPTSQGIAFGAPLQTRAGAMTASGRRVGLAVGTLHRADVVQMRLQ
jgi:hypothetical protein